MGGKNRVKKVNYHTHTKRCKHAGGSDEEYIESAIKSGFQELGFADHTHGHLIQATHQVCEWI